MKSNNSKKEIDIQTLANNYIVNRSESNYKALVDRLYFGLKSHVYKIIGSWDDSDEVLCLTFTKMWKNIDQYDSTKAKFSTWIHKVAFNEALQYKYRNDKSHRDVIPIDINDIYESTMKNIDDTDNSEYVHVSNNTDMMTNFIEAGSDDIMSRPELIQKLYDISFDCIKFLPKNVGDVWREKITTNKTMEQIAEEMNIPITSVKNWIYKARHDIGNMIKANYKELYAMYANE